MWMLNCFEVWLWDSSSDVNQIVFLIAKIAEAVLWVCFSLLPRRIVQTNNETVYNCKKMLSLYFARLLFRSTINNAYQTGMEDARPHQFHLAVYVWLQSFHIQTKSSIFHFIEQKWCRKEHRRKKYFSSYSFNRFMYVMATIFNDINLHMEGTG